MWSSQYTKELKERVINAYLSGSGDVSQVSKDYGIPTSTIKNWISRYWDEKELELQEEAKRKKEEWAKAANRRKRHFVNGRELKVVRPTSGSAYIDWRNK